MAIYFSLYRPSLSPEAGLLPYSMDLITSQPCWLEGFWSACAGGGSTAH